MRAQVSALERALKEASTSASELETRMQAVSTATCQQIEEVLLHSLFGCDV
jgi:hypothetical protein